jgi:hypothetical protein
LGKNLSENVFSTQKPPSFLCHSLLKVSLKLLAMEVITIQSEAFQAILKRLEEIEKKALEKEPDPKNVLLDNQEFCQLLKISKRTAQSYRDQGLVSFSQIGSKVYYLLSDVHKLMNDHKRKAFK